MKKYILLLLITILPAAWTMAQENSIDRKYVPIIQKTAALPLFNLTISEWSAYRYNQKADAWSAIPFQFDELKDNGRYDHLADDKTDANDELVVMPADLGDRAESSQWLDDAATRTSPRIELEFADPLAPGKSGWIYLYRNVTTKPIIQPFLDYAPGQAGTPAADTVKTRAFSLGHNRNGWMDLLTIGADKRDIIDRFKLRIAGDMFIGPAYDINEDFVEAQTGNEVVYFFPGPVRAFHIIKANFLLEKLKIPLLPKKSTFDYHFQYFPNSFKIAADTDIDASILSIFGVQLMRQSLDLTENAMGMTIYSPFNRGGMSVDGVADTPVEAVTGGVDNNWVMAAGSQGAIVLLFEISPMKNSKRLIYLHDDATSGKSGDGTQDTGDGKSFGDMGIMVKATGSALISDRLTVYYKAYFIDEPNLDASFGEQVIAWDQNPLNMTVREQYLTPAAVKQSRILPGKFTLFPAYPNPFNPIKQKSVRFEFEAPATETYELVLYNILGQQVAQFSADSSTVNGKNIVLWDGRDAYGLLLHPGVYFLHLKSGMDLQTQKLVIQ